MIEHYSYKIQNIIQKELFQAKKSIKIAVAWFTNDLLFQPLLLKLQSGVSVELILNKDEINESEENDIDFSSFLNVGGILHWNKSKTLMHDKFCIIDDTTVIYGSYNWTNKAEYNDESVAVSKEEKSTLDFYTKLFDKLSKSYPAEKYVGARPFNVYDPFAIEKAEIVSNLCGAIVYRWIINEKYVYRIFSQSTGKQACLYNFDDVIINTAPGVIVIGVKRLGMWAFYSMKKKEIEINRYDNIKLFGDEEPYFWIYTKDGIGVADKNGNEIIDCKYNNLTVCRDSYTIVEKNGLYGILIWADERYQELAPCIFKEVTEIDEKRFKVKDKNDKYGVISNNNIDIVKIIYDGIEPIEDDYYIVRQGNYKGVVAPGCIKIDCLYDDVIYKSKHQFIVKCNGKFGLYVDGKLQIPCEYDELYPNGVSLKKGKFGVITVNGEIKIPFKYSKIIKPDYLDAPYNQPFYLVYERPYFGIWMNGTEIGEVADEKYLLNEYIREFSLFIKNEDEQLEEVRHAIIRTIFQEIVHPSEIVHPATTEYIIKWEGAEKRSSGHYSFKLPEKIEKVERQLRQIKIADKNSLILDENIRSNARCLFGIERLRFKYTKIVPIQKSGRRIVGTNVVTPLEKIEYERLDCSHRLYEEGDILHIPKDAPVIIDKYGRERRYIIIKIHNPTSGKTHYSTFNPGDLIRKAGLGFKTEGSRVEKLYHGGSAVELCRNAKNADEILNILTHNKSSDCKLRISYVNTDMLTKIIGSTFNDYRTAYLYTFDLYFGQ